MRKPKYKQNEYEEFGLTEEVKPISVCIEALKLEGLYDGQIKALDEVLDSIINKEIEKIINNYENIR